jgi:cytochrome c biogenesis protein CcmG/thiol:disulfide interchange protein DsbE
LAWEANVLAIGQRPQGFESLTDGGYPSRVSLRIFWPVTIAAAALVGLLAYGLASKGTDTTLEAALARGERPPAPSAPLPWLHQDGTGSLADYKGKVVVLNVWASWCEPCREEVPLLQETHEQISSKGGLVLGVDTQDASNKALAFLKELNATFPSLRDRDRSYGRRFGVFGYPETFLIDRKGRIAALKRAPVTKEWLDEHLPRLLEEQA